MTSLKVAEVLIVGSDFSKVAQLQDLKEITAEGLAPYEQEIRAVQGMYRSIWQFGAYLDPTYWDKQPLVEWALHRELGFPNDRLLSDEIGREEHGVYGLLAGELREEIAPKYLPQVIARVDADSSVRMRLGENEGDLVSRLRKIIGEVNAEATAQTADQMKLPGLDPAK
jgi:hypothetical protein